MVFPAYSLDENHTDTTCDGVEHVSVSPGTCHEHIASVDSKCAVTESRAVRFRKGRCFPTVRFGAPTIIRNQVHV